MVLFVIHGWKMSCKAWYKSMTKYVDNVHSYDFERPSLEGQNQ